jgi:hypothetical protein
MTSSDSRADAATQRLLMKWCVPPVARQPPSIVDLPREAEGAIISAAAVVLNRASLKLRATGKDMP